MLLLCSCPGVSNSLSLDCSMPGLPVPHHLLKFAQVYSLHQQRHQAILFSDTLFPFCPQSCPASGNFPVSRLFASVQFSSVAQSCPTLCDPMNRSTPGLPVHHQLPEFTQTHVHRVSDAIQPSHPLLFPSPPAFSPSQHQSLFQ